ncbi:hypothetical protein BLNAU_11799 [Blattamonas nauphoetae]|uniref:BLOC-1-related complex subunit 5 n=1 Tax=Blattamonas nauphoetae TaxID=2049346 RepID=A0ABQ9XS27_9EUKA|nr:hypothetical protein BLNAU_11799 [Blattamonas nauphoetae]
MSNQHKLQAPKTLEAFAPVLPHLTPYWKQEVVKVNPIQLPQSMESLEHFETTRKEDLQRLTARETKCINYFQSQNYFIKDRLDDSRETLIEYAQQFPILMETIIATKSELDQMMFRIIDLQESIMALNKSLPPPMAIPPFDPTKNYKDMIKKEERGKSSFFK